MKRSIPTAAAVIKQTKPFRSAGHEAVIALALASGAVRTRFARVVSEHGGHGDDGGLTPQQYNVLRILRGAGASGLPTLEIASRMVERTPGITRLLDRLDAAGLITRARGGDRRVVVARATARALKVLGDLDARVDALEVAATDCLSPTELKTLVRLLMRVHAHQPA